MATPTATAAIAPPSGQVTDFNAPDELYNWNILCQTLCLAIPGIMWLMRLYVRIWVKRSWILEDYLAVLSYLSLFIYSMLLTHIIAIHGGVHEWNLTMPTVINMIYWVNVVQIWYGPAAAFIKSTILILYLRVFSPRRWTGFDISIRAFIAIICLFYTAISIAKILQCLPREKIWNAALPGTCVNLSVLLDISGIFNIVSDVLILLVPLKGLWGLKMSRKKKIGIYTVFTVGIVGPVFSIIGFVMRFELINSRDQSFNQPVVLMWATAELATGMMIICMPTLPGILQSRKQRPSLNNSRVSQPSNFVTSVHASNLDKQRFRSNYIELPDRHGNGRFAQPEQETHIKSEHSHYSSIGSDESVAQGQILKTVTMEQTHQ